MTSGICLFVIRGRRLHTGPEVSGYPTLQTVDYTYDIPVFSAAAVSRQRDTADMDFFKQKIEAAFFSHGSHKERGAIAAKGHKL